MNRQAQAAILFLTGAALLHAGLTNLYLRYVKAGLQPLLLASGAILILASLATVWYEWRDRKPKATEAHNHGDDHAHGQEDDHEHTHREPRISWLLVLPLLALILVAPPALGSYSAMRTGTALQQPYGYNKLPATGPLNLTVVDYAGRAVYDHGRSLAGRQIHVTGFVALDHAGAPYLVRMALNCCAADAQPVKIALTGKVPPVLEPDKWLEVTGTYTTQQIKDPVNNGPIPYLKITSAKPVPTPSDPYDESWNQ
ncbi:TIGR03943 family putative permease subunit [Streptomyces griseorubiginosus]|uniref:TIGR03943 family putative permease subunit n=1 Tax=Streptomyces griseorubiginosus TaxID=67304 RepID=UPI001AD75FA2|nr:TIGR03943 family protein [Streptomyces griseorubiginosus]MBO4256719.1 TIGR03943 family protein [Streptomyces griseorubiginosus]